MLNFVRSIFGSVNDRKLRPFKGKVQKINDLEVEFEALSDAELKAKTDEFRVRHQQGEKLDDLMSEAFAVVREAAKRTLGQRHYDVQLLGGMALHTGAIAEMRTGEGKTLVATLAVYLNALAGKGVHVVTVNDYLAQRDAEWMGQIYSFLGLTYGCVIHGMDDAQRREAYHADVTYGTNNEFGFDYLRDNMKYSLQDMVQRGHNFAIVDEVDSILIDESRTPLIISGPTEDRSDLYIALDSLIPRLVDEDYEIDEKQRSVTFTEEGNEKIEDMLTRADLLEGSLYEPANISLVHHSNQALRAHKIFARDKDYIVKDGEVVLIDEFTGRMTPGRRLSEGLHQAIEAKERVEIQPENQTLASITFQNYFRLYNKLAGMTGTADTEASEFAEIYKLEVISIPTNRDIQRLDDEDVVYRTKQEKYNAIVEDIKECHERGQPILVGTVSIEKSEELAEQLKAAGVPHNVLNARHHEQEAHIVAQAGVPGAVTVATNMAGRGTDIQLGGNPDMLLEEAVARADKSLNEDQIASLKADIEVDVNAKKEKALQEGGLYVLASERHESRRIDNQLRGRTGRQGDPGKSKFYICLEDDLLRIFAADRLDAIMRRLGLEEGEAITHPWMSKAMETSQKRIEQRNFEIRKNTLKFDDVINDQRKAIFAERIEYLQAADVAESIRDMRHECVEDIVAVAMPPRAYAEKWDIEGLAKEVEDIFNIQPPLKEWSSEEGIANEEIIERLTDEVDKAYAHIATKLGPERARMIEQQFLLQHLDMRWREHLSHLDHLRSVIHLRAHAQRDPLNEFKSEAFTLFEDMLADLRRAVTTTLMHIQFDAQPEPLEPPSEQTQIHSNDVLAVDMDDVSVVGTTPARDAGSASQNQAPEANPYQGVRRNDRCPCGSGKKFKHCHGMLGAA